MSERAMPEDPRRDPESAVDALEERIDPEQRAAEEQRRSDTPDDDGPQDSGEPAVDQDVAPEDLPAFRGETTGTQEPPG